MTPEQYQRVGEHFGAALELAPEDRASFLAEACGTEVELLREVESLLMVRAEAHGFISGKIAGLAAEMAEQQQNPSPAPSLIGQSLGHYEILSSLGAGGMGQVYLAQDTRLGRKVALNVLLPAFTRDQERLLRFQQEARAVSLLNHPNILTLYEIGVIGETHYIATEFVDGQTLREKIRGGQIGLSEILDLATQIASALAVAHQAGIVHRDIKPENVMTRRDGIVKVLDFGLAKLTEDRSPLEVVALQKVTTAAGFVMGTPQYMSPEQARGEKADARSDIFSLGVVLYEMVTGRPPFEGVNQIEVMGAILKLEPAPIERFAPAASAQLQKIIGQALSKEREHRYQTSESLLLDLKELKEELFIIAKYRNSNASDSSDRLRIDPAVRTAEIRPDITAPTAHRTAGTKAFRTEIRRYKRAAALALTLLIAATAGAGWLLYRYVTQLQSQPGSADAIAQIVTTFPGSESSPSFSPDRSQIAFTWGGEKEGNRDIYVKQIVNETLLRLTTNTAEDIFPSWSPDGLEIAFIRQKAERDELYVIPSIGGAERKLTDFSPFLYWGGEGAPSWSPDGKWIAVSDRGTPHEPSAIFLVSRETGEKRKFTSPPARLIGDSKPAISPDGKTLAFVRYGQGLVSDIYLAAMDGGEPRRLTFENAIILFSGWTSDSRDILFLGYIGNTGLWRAPVTGEKPQRVIILGPNVMSFAVSRQGNYLAWAQGTNDTNIWQIQLSGGAAPAARKHTAKVAITSTKAEYSPQFSPDGKRIVFASDRSGNSEIWTCASDCQNPTRLTFFNQGVTGSPRWSPDGQQIVFDGRKEGSADIFVINAEGGNLRRLTTENSEEIVPSWSRDGRWIYFCSNRSGNHQIWKIQATGGQAEQVTRQGGFECTESPDGKYLYYLKGRNQPGIWRLPTASGEETFVLDQHRAGLWRQWAIIKDGIYFATSEEPDHPRIEFFNFATGKFTPVFTLEKRLPGTAAGLSVSPDGRWLLWTQTDQFNTDIMMTRGLR